MLSLPTLPVTKVKLFPYLHLLVVFYCAALPIHSTIVCFSRIILKHSLSPTCSVAKTEIYPYPSEVITRLSEYQDQFGLVTFSCQAIQINHCCEKGQDMNDFWDVSMPLGRWQKPWALKQIEVWKVLPPFKVQWDRSSPAMHQCSQPWQSNEFATRIWWGRW